MKSLLILRSPVYQRKKYLGVLKSRRKKLGNLYLDQDFNASDFQRLCIYTSSYSRSERTAKKLCQKLDLDIKCDIQIKNELADMDAEDSIEFLKSIPNDVDCAIVLIPGVTSSMMLYYLTGVKTVIPFGQSKLVNFDIKDWSELTNSSIKAGNIKILKSA